MAIGWCRPICVCVRERELNEQEGRETCEFKSLFTKKKRVSYTNTRPLAINLTGQLNMSTVEQHSFFFFYLIRN